MTRRVKRRREWDARNRLFWAIWWVLAAVTVAFAGWTVAVIP